MSVCLRSIAVLAVASSLFAQHPPDNRGVKLWVLQPVVRPQVPAGATRSSNPIDAFIAAEYKAKGLRPARPGR